MDFKNLYDRITNKLMVTYLDNKKKIDFGLRIAGVAQNIRSGKAIEALNSSIGMFDMIGREFYYGSDLLNSQNGWLPLFNSSQRNVITLFDLEQYPVRELKINGDVKIYTLPNGGEVATFKSAYYWHTIVSEYYNSNLCSKDEVMDILINDAFKYVDSSCICLSAPDNGKQGLSLVAYDMQEYSSDAADQLHKYINSSIEKSIPRSIMLCGEPGAGKSCVASSLMKKLGLKTLVIKDIMSIGFETIQLVIDMLKIEAILMDDLDHKTFGSSSAMLGFLEQIRKNVKVVLATVNSTKDFHKALLRPGRFDKIFTVTRLDDQTIKNLLGPELEPYFDKVANLPIAYINEFVLSAKLEDKENLEAVITDLQKRFSSDSINLDLELKAYLKKAIEEGKISENKTEAKIA